MMGEHVIVTKGKRKAASTFAEIVQQEALATHEGPRRVPDWRDGGGLPLTLVDEHLAPERARQLVASGADLAWDDCGSKGRAAPVHWFDDRVARDLAAKWAPELGRPSRGAGWFELYRREDGSFVVLATWNIRWGNQMA
jgi:hypothetical protein